MDNPVTLKGTKDGLVIILSDEAWDVLLADLEERLAHAAAFFAGGQVILQTGERDVETEELETVVGLLNAQGMTLTSVLSESAATRRAAQRLGYDTGRLQRRPPPAGHHALAGGHSASQEDRCVMTGHLRPSETTDGMVVRRTLRSGQSVRHPGSVIIIGDVNPGAEIVAGGDVIVWGRLRGMVHAGALGDDQAFVCALSLAPTQLRIGNQIARPPEGETAQPRPEKARVKDGRIVVEGWMADSR